MKGAVAVTDFRLKVYHDTSCCHWVFLTQFNSVDFQDFFSTLAVVNNSLSPVFICTFLESADYCK